MSLSYDVFTGEFLAKVSEYDFIKMELSNRIEVIDGFMKRAIAGFKRNCKYDLFTTADDVTREFDVDVAEEDLYELANIISEGMLVQWLKPYVYQQELLQNVLNTRDYTQYSPAELLLRVGNAYAKAQHDYTQAIREYSYNHGDLGDLHL